MQNNSNKGSYFQPQIPIDSLKQMTVYEQKRKAEKHSLIRTGLLIGGAILAYLLIQTIITSVTLNDELKSLLNTSSVFSSCYTMIVVHLFSVALPFGFMALILRRQFITPVVPTKKTPKSQLFAWVSFGMILCVLSNYTVGLLIEACKQFGYQLTKTETPSPDSIFACVALVFSTAIVPPICEEFAMRCCTLGALRKFGTGFAVFTVSVVFGLLHGNVIQFVFAFLIGLVLAYITVRTDNILPAVLIHGFNNGISVLNDIATYAIGKDSSEYVIAGAYLIWIVFGIIGFIYLICKKQLLPPKKEKAPKEPYALSIGTRIACLIPGFILPFFMLIYITVKTIEKI